MVGEDHEVEPAMATTATVPWLLTYFLHAGCSKIGHSGCPVHNRRSQNRAFHALQALVKLAAQGDATDTMPLRTSWGEGYLSADGTFLVDAGWRAKMQDIQQRASPLLTDDPRGRHGGPSPEAWTCLASTLALHSGALALKGCSQKQNVARDNVGSHFCHLGVLDPWIDNVGEHTVGALHRRVVGMPSSRQENPPGVGHTSGEEA